jgi:hypothetical protein
MQIRIALILLITSTFVFYAWELPIDIIYTLDSASNYSAIQKLKP